MTPAFAPANEEEQLAYDLVTSILLDAATELSSDVHIEPLRQEAVVRYRVDGALQEISRHPVGVGRSTCRVLKRMCLGDPNTEHLPQDGRILMQTSAAGLLDVRVSTFPTVFGERVCMRLAESGQSLGLGHLGLSGSNLQAFEAMLTQPYGLVLLTGPIGSGKSITARAALASIAERGEGRHSIMTLEEPVEVFVPGVVQTQVDSQGELTYPRALKALMRQDPDVIYCADVPSAATASQILQAGLGGHLVLAQLTALDAPAALQSFVELGLEQVQVHHFCTLLQGVVAQRLARKICTHCQVEAPVPAALRELDLGEAGFRRGEGCEHCRHTGLRGRTGIFQVLPRLESLAPLLMQHMPLSEFRAELARLGHPSLRDCALGLARQGLINLEEALRCSA